MKAAIKHELDRLKQKDGRLMPQTVIEAARDKNSPLHSAFTWDASVALQKNLVREAQALISEYTVVVTVGDKTVRARHFVSLSTDRRSGGGYRAMETVMSDAVMRQQLLEDALSDLTSFRARYERLQELAEVFAAIETVQSKRKKAA